MLMYERHQTILSLLTNVAMASTQLRVRELKSLTTYYGFLDIFDTAILRDSFSFHRLNYSREVAVLIDSLQLK